MWYFVAIFANVSPFSTVCRIFFTLDLELAGTMTGEAAGAAAGVETTGPGVAAVGAAAAGTGDGGWPVERAWAAGVFVLSHPPARLSIPIAMVKTAAILNNIFIFLVLIFNPFLLLILVPIFTFA